MTAHLADSNPPRLSLLVGLFLCLGCAAGAAIAGDVLLLSYEGPITPVASEYLVAGLLAAPESGAEAVVIQLDTPGGLDTAMRDIIKAEMGSTIPVIVFVGPAGSRAASAGAFITVAAHVAVMAPGSNIGSASPVQMAGAAMDSTMKRKVTNDAAAYIASIAEQRERDPDIARSFVVDAVNLTAAEAHDAGVVDFLAADLTALRDSLLGREVEVAGTIHRLDGESLRLVPRPMSLRQRLLKTLADPNVAYILMLLGIYGLFFELSNPGSFAPGILGAICLLLALFAFQALPVDYTGVALILLGVILLLLEIKVPSFGLLSIGGVASLVLGSLMLFDSSEPWARVSLRVMIPTVLVFAAFFLACVWLAVRGLRRPVVSGPQSLIGSPGRVVQAIAGGDEPGKVVFHGEIWDACADVPVPAGGTVRVVEFNGRMARVKPESPPPAPSPSPRS